MRKQTRQKYIYFLQEIPKESGKYSIDELCKKYNVSNYLLNFTRIEGYTENKNNRVVWTGKTLTGKMIDDIFRNYIEKMKIAKHNSRVKLLGLKKNTLPMFNETELTDEICIAHLKSKGIYRIWKSKNDWEEL